METLDFGNPLFATYAIATSVMILKGVAMSWLTVYRMIRAKGGYRSPEDLRQTPINPSPSPEQLHTNDYVDRVRRIQLNDLESVPYFLVAGLLFVLTGPPLLLAQALLYGFAVSRLAHFAAYAAAANHETRATLWTLGSLILVFITGWVLVFAVRALT